ncbi:MAG: hypothetical protein COU63_01415 [Candidatus Pacebacteria bacterium CG10_big_fil_rev_8_21_14_0_10_36_11]|nr:hypothetical protein [Candidatus Pacearchaeota archaeon]OIP73754.1 MAG: hypothetical protein AUK08_04305 [Candidatus Pacebacteria bacterium CG2_30_36_39]PIR64661.1 MAG: hypothetical protein COU63_01415 [Candidatus Pacebacteria bacterium CG10_big_fil_rev_8_21_14_0_10_36_11]PJC42730.1 MAG: hypothetical protein CO040_02795 [Candidatus Pacebacteria bacterium CG_4_9_14_0_2_um_filter_36_8]
MQENKSASNAPGEEDENPFAKRMRLIREAANKPAEKDEEKDIWNKQAERGRTSGTVRKVFEGDKPTKITGGS